MNQVREKILCGQILDVYLIFFKNLYIKMTVTDRKLLIVIDIKLHNKGN